MDTYLNNLLFLNLLVAFKMNVLVTGGAGFIGSHAVDLLIEKGHGVTVIDDLSHGNKNNINSGAKFHKLDINSQKAADVIKKNSFDVILHLAAQVNSRISFSNPLLDARTNILGSLNLMESARKNNVNKFVFASSVAVYGEPKYRPCDELHPVKPINNYGLSKLTVERYLHLYNRLYGLDYSILRFSNVYGPRQDADGEAGVVSIFINNLLNNNQINIYGDGNQTRDFVYVGDVAEALIKVLGNNTGKKIMNISTNTGLPINQLLEMLKKFNSSMGEAIHANSRVGEIRHMKVDNSAARKEILWEPNTSMKDGLKKTFDFYKDLNQIMLKV
jgi:UDP-glucose 4-epimerase